MLGRLVRGVFSVEQAREGRLTPLSAVGHSFVTTTAMVTALAKICAIAPNNAT